MRLSTGESSSYLEERLPPVQSDHARIVSEFQRDIVELTLSDVIRKHITTGVPHTIDAGSYFEVRSQVASQFDLHPNDVIVVGSSRLGFSLKPKKRFLPIEPADVDLAIVSEPLFNQYWDLIFDQVHRNRQWATSENRHRQFVRSLFSGWISPSKLPPIPSFTISREWVEFFDFLSRSRICGIRRISARLYRDWDRLEAYQGIHVSDCKKFLKGASQ